MEHLWDTAPGIWKDKKVHFAVLEEHCFNSPFLVGVKSQAVRASKWNLQQRFYFSLGWCWSTCTFCFSLNNLSCGRVWKCLATCGASVWKLGVQGLAWCCAFLSSAQFFCFWGMGVLWRNTKGPPCCLYGSSKKLLSHAVDKWVNRAINLRQVRNNLAFLLCLGFTEANFNNLTARAKNGVRIVSFGPKTWFINTISSLDKYIRL